MVWVNCTMDEPNSYHLGTKMIKYAGITAVLTVLQQAAKMAMEQLVICLDSNYANFSSCLPLWKENGMRNARNREVKNSPCDRLRDDSVLEEGQGPLPNFSPNKEGNDEADRRAILGAEQDTPWEFREEWLLMTKSCAANTIICLQTSFMKESSGML